MREEEPKMTLQERCRKLWAERGLTADQIEAGILRLSPEAIANSDKIGDEQIIGGGVSVALFWGLGNVMLNYLRWERAEGGR